MPIVWSLTVTIVDLNHKNLNLRNKILTHYGFFMIITTLTLCTYLEFAFWKIAGGSTVQTGPNWSSVQTGAAVILTAAKDTSAGAKTPY